MNNSKPRSDQLLGELRSAVSDMYAAPAITAAESAAGSRVERAFSALDASLSRGGPLPDAWQSRRRHGLSDAARAVIAGLVAPSSAGINVDGIHASDEVWSEIRAAFPLSLFEAWVLAGGTYYPDAGM